MDREIAPQHIRQTRRRRWITALASIAVLVVAMLFFRRFLDNAVEQSKIRVSVVERGVVDNTISATGEVVPAYEQIMTSPIRAGITKVLLNPGARVKPGDAIFELDKAFSLIELEKIKDQLALKRNAIGQLELTLNKNIGDADLNDQIKLLQINRLKADLEDTRRLQTVGGSTREDVTRAESSLQQALLEKKQLENELRYNRQSMGSSLKEAELAASMEQRNLDELEYKLRLADIRADRNGVITWVNHNIGSAINEGEILARIADLESFSIDASCADVYAPQLRVGLPVQVKLNEKKLNGLIANIKPAISNGVVEFSVQLDDAKSEQLRPKQKVEIFVVTDRQTNTLRVANGPAFKGGLSQDVYVLKGDKAERRTVQTGLSNFDFVEIKSGLDAGEKVIVTDLAAQFGQAKTIRIKAQN